MMIGRKHGVRKQELSMFFNYLDVLKDERKERERNRYSSQLGC